MSLQDIISKSITENAKPIGFDVFMNFALYHSKFGYYRSNKSIIGKQGDFITAPEISDLFGYSIARQCKQILNEGDILEFGAGSGVLSSQILFELARLDCLPNKYFIIELSARLKIIQRDTIKKVLPELIDRVEWLSELPKDFTGVIIANEVLDAMPAKRVRFSNGKFNELGVGFNKDGFCWKDFDVPFVNDSVRLPHDVEEGYTTEVNLHAIGWIKSLCDSIKEGTILLIDYGMDRSEYFHSQRNDGTLKCFYKHKAGNDPFCNIGIQDITTSVNFSDIADSAIKSGFEVSGYCTQAMFLISLGIEKYLLNEKDTNIRIDLAQQIKQLILPNEMGEVFKVMALSKKQAVKLDGFKEQDLTKKL